MSSGTLSDADLAKMGDDEARQYYADELQMKELVALTQDIERALGTNERAGLLAQKEDVLAHGDELATKAAAELPPPLRGPYEKARSEWTRVRAVLAGA